MLSTKNQIREILQDALSKLNISESPAIVVEYPEQAEHGHYSSPIAMVLARVLKKILVKSQKKFINSFKTTNYSPKSKWLRLGF